MITILKQINTGKGLVNVYEEYTKEESFNEDNNTDSVDTAFVNKPYSAVMSIIHEPLKPNFDIQVTGNLELTLVDTVNGNSGIVNLYFEGTEVVTLKGDTDVIITGTGEMVSVGFIHDRLGFRWYEDKEGSTVNTSSFALKRGTILHHEATATSTGTVTSSGTNWTGTGTSLTANMVGGELTVNGQKTIISTVNSGLQTFTTVDAIAVTSATFEIRCIAFKVLVDGSQTMYDKNGNARITLDVDGYLNNFLISNGQITSLAGAGLFAAGFSKMEVQNMETLYYKNITRLVSELRTDFPAGTTAMVSDANTPVSHATVVGGGSVLRPVYYNGTNWLCY